MSGLRPPHALALVLVIVAALSLAPLPAQQLSTRSQLDQAAKLLMNQGAREALKLLQPLLADGGAAADPRLSAEVLYHVGWAHFQLNDYPAAMDWYTRARDASRALGDRNTEARSVFSIAQTHKNRGEYPTAVELSEDALHLYEALGDPAGSARAWQLLGSIQDLTGRHREALASYGNARRLYGGARSQASVRLLNEIAITHKNLGNYQEALDLYKQAFDGLSEIGDRYGQAMVMNNLAKVHELLGQPELAIDGYRHSLEIAREINERRGQSMLLGNLGSMLLARGDDERASEYFEQQLRLTRTLGNRNEEADALSGLGEIHAARGEVSAARGQFERALAIQREIGAQARLGSTLLALADLAIAGGDFAAARRQADEALQLADTTETPELEWKARLVIGRGRAAQGRHADAIADLRASAAIVNNLRANVWSDSAKIGFLDDRQEVFQLLATTLMADGRAEEALEAVEAGRARAFADLLEQRQVRVRAGGQPILQDVRAALVAARDGRGPRVAAAGASDERSVRSGNALDDSLARLRTEDRELASLITAESPTRAEIGRIAARLDATFVEYLVTDRQLLSFVVRADGTVHSVAADIPRARLEGLTRDVRQIVDAPAGGASPPAALGAKLRELHGLLIAPLAQWLPTSPDRVVVIVPHGPLALVPFAALESESGTPLLAQHTLAFAPSISVYRYTPDKRRTSAGRPSALVVADPAPPRSSAMSGLPGAREEGRRVASQLRAGAVALLTGSSASEAVVKREAQNHRVLHFATHGLVSAEYPLASSLLLAAGDGDDGYLRADEIFGLSLNADLVVLSGCSTGLGKLSGDGIVGLSRAFIYAGTPAVVVSQWDVSDRATAFLMNQFYAQIRQQRPTAAALRHAQLETRRRFADPAHWAAFVVIGEPR